jgi:hypothetical protein
MKILRFSIYVPSSDCGGWWKLNLLGARRRRAGSGPSGRVSTDAPAMCRPLVFMHFRVLIARRKWIPWHLRANIFPTEASRWRSRFRHRCCVILHGSRAERYIELQLVERVPSSTYKTASKRSCGGRRIYMKFYGRIQHLSKSVAPAARRWAL